MATWWQVTDTNPLPFQNGDVVCREVQLLEDRPAGGTAEHLGGGAGQGAACAAVTCVW